MIWVMARPPAVESQTGCKHEITSHAPALLTPNQNNASTALETSAKYESQYPYAARAAIGKEMCKLLPIAPLSTIGTALQRLATKQINMASIADSPAATTELPWDHVDTVTRSENPAQSHQLPLSRACGRAAYSRGRTSMQSTSSVLVGQDPDRHCSRLWVVQLNLSALVAAIHSVCCDDGTSPDSVPWRRPAELPYRR